MVANVRSRIHYIYSKLGRFIWKISFTVWRYSLQLIWGKGVVYLIWVETPREWS